MKWTVHLRFCFFIFSKTRSTREEVLVGLTCCKSTSFQFSETIGRRCQSVMVVLSGMRKTGKGGPLRTSGRLVCKSEVRLVPFGLWILLWVGFVFPQRMQCLRFALR